MSPRSQKRQRPAQAALRLTEAELTALREQAAAAGQSVSAYLRDLVLAEQFGVGGEHS